MELSAEIVSFPMQVPFVITGHVFNETDTVRVTLKDGPYRGRGETVGTYYLDETAPSMLAEINAMDRDLIADLSTESLNELMPACGARNALDCALWDLTCKRQGRSIWDVLGLEPRELTTVFTIGLAEPEIMAERAAAAARFPHLKIKLDGDRPIERLEGIRRARPDARLVIDVNQGWAYEELIEYLPHCERLGVDLVEQPLARGADAALEGLDSPVPLGADESCLHMGEFAETAKRYQVLNIKLDKCGGLSEGLALVQAARGAGMDVMVGNMTGSSLSMAPSYVIGQYCRFVDIDGPLLLAEDIEAGLEYRDGGRVALPRAELWG